MLRLNDIVEKVTSYLPEADVEVIKRAYVYSAKVHAGQKRSSGESYLGHPLEVAGLRKLFLATAKDIRVVLVKLADRLHNMRTLEYLPEDRQKRISKETLEIYSPLAHRLGIYWIRTELEDLSFRFLNPEEYENISKLIAKKKKEWEKYVESVKGILEKQLMEFGIKAEITGRFKHIYAIYNKMQTQNLEFDQVHDVIAFRSITSSLRECYEALGAVHSAWKPVPGRFKDYIALPKGNGYQTLHTTVIGPFGERMEVQIRTQRMHEIAEYGIAAHWKYKEGRIEAAESDKIYASLRQLLEWKDIKDPTEFLEAVKGELIPNMVFVFTPKGDLKELPNGATPVDFAYSIHTEVGNHCTRARANGKLVPLDYKLRSGDTVEIATLPDKKPSRDWLRFVITSRAKTKIRSLLRTEEREQSKLVGKSICERKFKQHGLDYQKMLKSGELSTPLSELGFKEVDEFYLALGYGKVSVTELLKRILPKEKLEGLPEKESMLERIIQTLTRSTKSGVLVKGFDDVMIRFGNCCTPLPGENIVGYITRGRGITIHKQNCSQLLDVDPARKIDVAWDRGFKETRPARIEVICAGRPGILSSITRSIASSDINISKAEIHSTDDERAIGKFEIAVLDLNQLEGVMKSIKRLKGVISVEIVLGAEEI